MNSYSFTQHAVCRASFILLDDKIPAAFAAADDNSKGKNKQSKTGEDAQELEL